MEAGLKMNTRGDAESKEATFSWLETEQGKEKVALQCMRHPALQKPFEMQLNEALLENFQRELSTEEKDGSTVFLKFHYYHDVLDTRYFPPTENEKNRSYGSRHTFYFASEELKEKIHKIREGIISLIKEALKNGRMPDSKKNLRKEYRKYFVLIKKHYAFFNEHQIKCIHQLKHAMTGSAINKNKELIKACGSEPYLTIEDRESSDNDDPSANTTEHQVGGNVRAKISKRLGRSHKDEDRAGVVSDIDVHSSWDSILELLLTAEQRVVSNIHTELRDDKTKLSDDERYSGSTFTSVFFHGGKVYLIWIGDSPAIALITTTDNEGQQTTEVMPLNWPHKVGTENEARCYERELAKENLASFHGDHRLGDRFFNLAVSRAVGDLHITGVSDVPCINVVDMPKEPNKRVTFVVGSDGLFDALSLQEIIGIATKTDSADLANALGAAAYKKERNEDNIIAVVSPYAENSALSVYDGHSGKAVSQLLVEQYLQRLKSIAVMGKRAFLAEENSLARKAGQEERKELTPNKKEQEHRTMQVRLTSSKEEAQRKQEQEEKKKNLQEAIEKLKEEVRRKREEEEKERVRKADEEMRKKEEADEEKIRELEVRVRKREEDAKKRLEERESMRQLEDEKNERKRLAFQEQCRKDEALAENRREEAKRKREEDAKNASNLASSSSGCTPKASMEEQPHDSGLARQRENDLSRAPVERSKLFLMTKKRVVKQIEALRSEIIKLKRDRPIYCCSLFSSFARSEIALKRGKRNELEDLLTNMESKDNLDNGVEQEWMKDVTALNSDGNNFVRRTNKSYFLNWLPSTPRSQQVINHIISTHKNLKKGGSSIA